MYYIYFISVYQNYVFYVKEYTSEAKVMERRNERLQLIAKRILVNMKDTTEGYAFNFKGNAWYA